MLYCILAHFGIFKATLNILGFKLVNMSFIYIIFKLCDILLFFFFFKKRKFKYFFFVNFYDVIKILISTHVWCWTYKNVKILIEISTRQQKFNTMVIIKGWNVIYFISNVAYYSRTSSFNVHYIFLSLSGLCIKHICAFLDVHTLKHNTYIFFPWRYIHMLAT